MGKGQSFKQTYQRRWREGCCDWQRSCGSFWQKGHQAQNRAGGAHRGQGERRLSCSTYPTWLRTCPKWTWTCNRWAGPRQHRPVRFRSDLPTRSGSPWDQACRPTVSSPAPVLLLVSLAKRWGSGGQNEEKTASGKLGAPGELTARGCSRQRWRSRQHRSRQVLLLLPAPWHTACTIHAQHTHVFKLHKHTHTHNISTTRLWSTVQSARPAQDNLAQIYTQKGLGNLLLLRTLPRTQLCVCTRSCPQQSSNWRGSRSAVMLVGVANGHSKKPPCLPGTPNSRCSQHARDNRSLVSAGGRETMSAWRALRGASPRGSQTESGSIHGRNVSMSRSAQRSSPTCWRRAPWAPGQPRRRRKPSPLPCCDSSTMHKKRRKKEPKPPR